MSSSSPLTVLRLRSKSLAAAFLSVMLTLCALSFAGCASSNTALPKGFEEAELVRVIDGDTLVVNVNGEDEKLRLIGVDTPESVHNDKSKNIPEGDEASAFTSSLLEPGQTIYLEKDTSDTDRYGRLLRYVWLEVPSDPSNTDEIRIKMLNGILVDQGYAQAKRYKPDTKNNEVFTALMEDAIANDRGVSYLWK